MSEVIEICARIVIWGVTLVVAGFVVGDLRRKSAAILKHFWLPTMSSAIVVWLGLAMLTAALELTQRQVSPSGLNLSVSVIIVILALGGSWWGTRWLLRRFNVFASAVGGGLLVGALALICLNLLK